MSRRGEDGPEAARRPPDRAAPGFRYGSYAMFMA